MSLQCTTVHRFSILKPLFFSLSFFILPRKIRAAAFSEWNQFFVPQQWKTVSTQIFHNETTFQRLYNEKTFTRFSRMKPLGATTTKLAAVLNDWLTFRYISGWSLLILLVFAGDFYFLLALLLEPLESFLGYERGVGQVQTNQRLTSANK